MRPNVIAAVAVASMGASVAAPAAADWTAPVAISQPHGQVAIGGVGYTASGGPVAWWTWYDDAGGRTAAGWAMASASTSGAAFGSERALPADLAAGPAPYGGGRVVIATQTDHIRQAPRYRRSSTLRVLLGDLDGRFGRPKLIVRRPHAIENAQLAVNARGEGVLAWSEYRPGRDAIYASVRRRGAFGPAVLLGTGAIRGVSAAVGAGGDALVAWDARGRVRTRYRGRADRAFRGVDELRSQTTFSAALQSAVSPSGRAWVAWTSQLRTEGGTIGDAYIQVARRPAGAARFEHALLLDHGPAGGAAFPSPVSLAAGPRGSATLAWTMKRRDTTGEQASTTVSVADVSAAGVARVKPLARFDASEFDEHAAAAWAGDGTLTVAWMQPPDAQSGDAMQAFAAQRQADGDWGAPRVVSAGPVSGLKLASSPGGGAPTLLLAHRAAGVMVVEAVALG